MEENLFSHPRPSCCQCQHETAEKPLKHLDFRLELIKSLLDGHVPRIDHRLFSSTSELPLRLSERPFPEPIPSHSKYGGCDFFEVCRARGKAKQTQYQCKVCHVPLHIYPCMKIYQTVRNYHSQ